ncbi:hypothetical protein [Bacillus paranthracis]|uniref:hypothetical protein n=1 Tax=Bacillus paranthracis TaxID=2026186 RepID=UPI0022DEE8F5|nr:hypothetical protein [Bacillus paranthracis]
MRSIQEIERFLQGFLKDQHKEFTKRLNESVTNGLSFSEVMGDFDVHVNKILPEIIKQYYVIKIRPTYNDKTMFKLVAIPWNQYLEEMKEKEGRME